MSSSNVMEVITVGRYEDEDQQAATGRSSTSHSTRAESQQLSLEYLPPEAPHYGQAISPTVLSSFDPERSDEPSTDDLVERLQLLSDHVRSELGHFKAANQPQHSPSSGPIDSVSSSSLGVSSMLEAECYDGDLMEEDGSSDAMSLASLRSREGVPSSVDGHPPSGGGGDPKLQSAMEKMKKLDKKLADLAKKEREVKRQRHLLEQQMEGGGAHTELVPVVEDIDQPPASPVFATQVEDSASSVHVAGARSKKGRGVEAGEGSGEEAVSSKTRQTQNKGGHTDFIQRNIELASEAGTLIAMTETEKRRLEELLNDDSPDTEGPYTAPLCLPASSSEDGGFALNEQDSSRMRDIDSRLQALMPAEEWESVCSSSSRNITPLMLTAATPTDEHPATLSDTDLETEVELPDLTGPAKHITVPGEEVLHEFQLSREAGQRLRDIDEKLRRLQQNKETEQHFVPCLPESELAKLLEECAQEQRETPAATRSSDHDQQLVEDVLANES